MGQIDFDGSNSTVKADVIRGQTGTTVKLGGLLDTDGNYIQTEKGGDLTSASPLIIDTDGSYFDVTGTTNFAAMTVAADRQFTLQFDGVLTMTHHATNLDLPGEANITTAAGDVATFQSTGSNTVQCINYTRADGTGIAGGGDFSDGGEAGGAARTLGNTDAYDFALETNNVEQLQIKGDSNAGVITTPNQSGVSVYRAGAFSVATGTITLYEFNTEDYDLQNEFDNVTNFRFTADTAGKYIVSLHSLTGAFVDSGNLTTLYLYKNGGSFTSQALRSSAANDYITVNFAVGMVLASSDYIDMRVWHNQGTTEDWLGGVGNSRFTINKIA